MNTYDFDETIYYGDSEFHFIEYIFKKYPLEMKKYARRYKFYRFLQKKSLNLSPGIRRGLKYSRF